MVWPQPYRIQLHLAASTLIPHFPLLDQGGAATAAPAAGDVTFLLRRSADRASSIFSVAICVAVDAMSWCTTHSACAVFRFRINMVYTL
jgi:hypothetical protein